MATETRTLLQSWDDDDQFLWYKNADGSWSRSVYTVNDPAVASGTITTATHTTATVTITTGAALAANTSRIWALFVNDSDTTIYLKLGVVAVANQGIRINANGGSFEMSSQSGNLYTGAVNAIHGGAGNKVLLVTEGV